MKRIVCIAAAGLAAVWMATGSTSWASDALIDFPLQCSASFNEIIVVKITNSSNEEFPVGTKMHVTYKRDEINGGEVNFALEGPMRPGQSATREGTGIVENGFTPTCLAWARNVPKPPPPQWHPGGGGKAPGSGPALRPK
jgi:hypothetical protein